ncbi:fimbrial protein [Acerihabitans sp. TG2]|uniref:fimbrial protein n=1 Tax=Acerihabitans sp. TG2 TaxID=3096008 RepID=UPI002B22A4E0|nr:fimbrial protein [Acerihabitans sp. TG2]MEA9389681.1 fimbrial protein [Acerihabitans sp. TG2]
MTIKLTLPALAIAGIMACGQATAADTGTITFTGTILTAACTVATASTTQTISMGNISNVGLTAGIGATALPTPVAIVIDDCPTAPTNISIRFSGSADAGNPTLLALDSGSVASGFGIALFESDGSTAINLGVDSAPRDVPIAGATLNFVAKLVSTAATIVEGAYTATANFTVIYN